MSPLIESNLSLLFPTNEERQEPVLWTWFRRKAVKERPRSEMEAGSCMPTHARTFLEGQDTDEGSGPGLLCEVAEPTVAGQRRTLTGFPF